MKAGDQRIHARSTVAVTAMGLGCAQMGNLYRVTPYAESAGAFEAAWDAGIRTFDTAPFYGYTRSELRLGTLLGERARASYTVSTRAPQRATCQGNRACASTSARPVSMRSARRSIRA